MHETTAKSILSAHNGMNIYRGCSHGCIYCDSRSDCYQMHHDFEDIEVKINAPQLLEQALRRKRRKCMVGTGSMTDPYVHLEQQLGLTRKCLEIISRYEFGLSILTKSDRILRDLDLLKHINDTSKCVVQMTLTTVDEALCRILEPNVSTTAGRARVLEIMQDNGIPTVVWLSPVLPFINDTEENLRGILEICARAGVYGIINFGFGLTLRDGNREYFYKMLDQHFPGMKERYIRNYGNAYEILSPNQKRLTDIFRQTCRDHGIVCNVDQIFSYLQAYENKGCTQLTLDLF